MFILIVDDMPVSVFKLQQDLSAAGHQSEVVDFKAMGDSISRTQPDMVVLDLGNNTRTHVGNTLYDTQIWQGHFCPVIVFSAHASQFDPRDQSLVECVEKGIGQEEKVLEAMERFRPYSESLSNLRKDIDDQARETLRDLTRAIANQNTLTAAQIAELVESMGRRRAAAYLDDQRQASPALPESQYVYPPTGLAFRFADLLRREKGKPTNPESFRLVLSPSCDLQPRGANGARIKKVLVARCSAASDVTPLKNVTANKLQEKIKGYLGDGYQREAVFLPSFLGLVPAMCADLKRLELLTYEDIGGGEYGVQGYSRVVTIDSPFRERIAWAYMNTAARPGVPDVDQSRWSKMY